MVEQRSYYIVNVTNYPLGDTRPSPPPPPSSSHPPQPQSPQDLVGGVKPLQRQPPCPPRTMGPKNRFRIQRLPQAYIGDSPARHTFIPFCLLLISSTILFMATVIISIRNFPLIVELGMVDGIVLCFLICIFDASIAAMGLKLLRKPIVSPGKLFTLHGMMTFGILLHILVPAYEFIPEGRPKKRRQDGGRSNYDMNRFPSEYWACRGGEREETFTGTCDQVEIIGIMFWSTIPLFVFLFIAWRIAVWRRPTPIHPNARTSSEFRELRRTARRERLSTIYRNWQETNNTQTHKPYFAHFPKPQVGPGGGLVPQGDENANLAPTPTAPIIEIDDPFIRDFYTKG